MIKKRERLYLIALAALCLVFIRSSVTAASLKLIDINPKEATANSVWNFEALWTDETGAWPAITNRELWDGLIDHGEGGQPTAGGIRPEQITVTGDQKIWDGPRLRLPIYLFGFKDDQGDGNENMVYQPNSWISLQPDPDVTIPNETISDEDPKYDHGLDVFNVTVPVDLTAQTKYDVAVSKGDAKVPDGHIGVMQGTTFTVGPMFINEQKAVADDPDTEVDETRPATKACIVLDPAPMWLVGVWTSKGGKPVPVKIGPASDLNKGDDTHTGWPNVPVLQIQDVNDLKTLGVKNLYIEYYGPGTHYVATKTAPLPMPYTVYRYPGFTNTKVMNIKYIPINDAILHLGDDPANPTDPNDPTTSRVLGIYDNEELDETKNISGQNYWQPGGYQGPGGSHPNNGWLMLSNMPNAGTPNEGVPATKDMYVKIATPAVDSVYDNKDGGGTNYFTNGAYDSKQGIVKLGTPLPDPHIPTINDAGYLVGQQCWVTYRPLSRNYVTVGRPITTVVQEVHPVPATDNYSFQSTATPTRTGKIELRQNNTLPLGTFGTSVKYGACSPYIYPQGVVWLNGSIPMRYVSGSPATGAHYRVSTSAGLNMSNPKQQPLAQQDPWNSQPYWDYMAPAADNKTIFDPNYWPMFYTGGFKAINGEKTTHLVSLWGWFRDANGKLVEVSENPCSIPVITHDSRAIPGMIDYGGTKWATLDWLTAYPNAASGSWPFGPDVDPLQLEPAELSNNATPDDGSSSTNFVFRVRYHNQDGSNILPPRPWLPGYADPESGMGPTGVVVYLESAPGQYRPHFMYLENPWAAPTDPDYDVYIYRQIPHHEVGISGKYTGFPFPTEFDDYLGSYYDDMTYASLACGVYHYFFACSDDSVKFYDGSFMFENQYPLSQAEWGQVPTWSNTLSTGLDPVRARNVAGYQEVSRTPLRKYSSKGTNNFDDTLYVDRPVRVPGYFEGDRRDDLKYPWDSQQHPVVTCELRMPTADEHYVRYDDYYYGTGRFMGTLANYQPAVNPTMTGSHGLGDPALLSETSGSKTQDDNVFRILYKQKDNKPPISIKVFVNNAAEKTAPAGASASVVAAHQYTSYTMYERADQVFPDPNKKYINGVWYEFKTKLPAGSHTYYFEANDGIHTARYPIRPDFYHYGLVTYDGNGGRKVDAADQFNLNDWWVPTKSLPTERGTATYVDNDYFPGPYVNHPAVLSEPTVTPGTGKVGDDFVYRVKYSDPDGQRPYKAQLQVRFNDNDEPRIFDMMPETPITLPLITDADYETKWAAITKQYVDGVYYIARVSSTDSQAFQQGLRRYRFMFTDDWGRQSDVNDLRVGELITLPAGANNWIDGPVVSGNIAPALTEGTVTSADGTANAATQWTFRVKYRDQNNDAPKLIKVYVGLLQSDGKTILWDDGHDLSPDTADSSKKAIYSDGVYYHFQTRLGAIDSVDRSVENEQEPKQYYYAFEAYDGIAWATYKSSSDPNLRSNSAGAMVYDNVQLVENADPNKGYMQYKLVPLVAQQGTVTGSVVTPSNPKDIMRVVGVYRNEDLTGNSLYDPDSDATPFKQGNTTINITTSLPVSTRVYVKYFSTDKLVVKPATPNGIVTSDKVVTIDPAIQPTVARVIRVYTDAIKDDPNANYYAPFNTIPINAGPGADPLTNKVWIQYEAESPLVGPLPVELPAPAGVMPDLELYKNIGSKAVPVLLDDVKNGWISDNDQNVRTVLSQNGLATYLNNPSAHYVTPEDPASIAGVEGVYLNTDLSGYNYYRPADLNTPIIRVAKVDPDVANKIIPLSPQEIAALPDDQAAYDPEEVVKIFGVYDNKDLTGTNYLVPDFTTLRVNKDIDPRVDVPWQQARIVGGGTIWPTNPNDIVAIRGVWQHAIEEVDGSTQGPAYSSPLNYFDPFETTGETIGTGTSNGNGDVIPDDPTAIRKVLAVYLADDKDMATNYYDDPNAAEYDGQHNKIATITPTTPVPPYTQVTIKYLRQPNFGFGRYNEYVALTRFLPDTATNPVYISYFKAQQPQADGSVVFYGATAPTSNYVYLKVWVKAFKPGDSVIKLTRDLPAVIDSNAAIVNLATVKPSNPSDIGYVNGVYTTADMTGDNYYLNDAGIAPNPWDFLKKPTTIGLGRQLPAGTTQVWVKYVPMKRRVYIKYDDMRFTHKRKGSAHQILSAYNENVVAGAMDNGGAATGSTHYSPDGWNVTDAFGQPNPQVPIKPNQYEDDSIIDITGGVVGVWKNDLCTGVNYFDPRQTSLYKNDFDPSQTTQYGPDAHLLQHLRLSQPVENLSSDLWARYYQKGEYHIDRYNRDITFISNQKPTDVMQASYFFGTKMPQLLAANTPPQLSAGTASPINGSRSTQYVYTVTYKDVDGPNGQAPYYVKVYIDGQGYDMTPVNKVGTPPYRDGAVYTYTASTLAGGSHKYRFEASDGIAVAWFDASDPSQPHSSRLGIVPTNVVDIDGPWVNNPPMLDKPADTPTCVSADPTKTITTDTAVTFYVNYSDLDGDEPYFYDAIKDIDRFQQPVVDGDLVSASPRLWLDSGANDTVVTGTIASLGPDPLETAKTRTINVAGNPGWKAGQFAGKLMQIADGGAATGRIYLIQSNTANQLVISVDDLKSDNLPVGSKFRINGLIMTKLNNAETDFVKGVIYVLQVPKMALGSHGFHFTARSRENKPDWWRNMMMPADEAKWPYSTEVRYPAINDLPAPTVVSVAPDGNVKPTLNADIDAQTWKGPASIWRGPQVAKVPVDPTNLNSVFIGGTTGIQGKLRRVLGVYAQESDAVAANGTNYYQPATAANEWKTGSVINLTSALPNALSDVWVRYYAVAPADGVYKAGEPLTFKVTYADPDGDAPTYHNNVQGYVRLVFNDSARSIAMLPVKASPTADDYKKGVTFATTVTDTPEGAHKYHFEASDGWHPVRFPMGTPSSETANDETLKVNNKPVLLNPAVDRTASTYFRFSVSYQDKDGVAPASIALRLTKDGASTSLDAKPMTPDSADTKRSYADGVLYYVDVTNLEPGLYHSVFSASDATQPADDVQGPDINARITPLNHHPVIASYSVTPESGKTLDNFTFTAAYKDDLGDAPMVALDGSKNAVNGLLLTITDPDTGAEQHLTMTRTTTGTVDYTQPVTYTKTITGKQIGPGTHTFTVSASDGERASVLAAGLPDVQHVVVKVPYFDIRVTGKDGSILTDRAVVGQEVLVTGKMAFPYVAGAAPGNISNITLRVTKPDGTPLLLNASIANMTEDDPADPKNWVGDIVANYDGSTDQALATKTSLTLTASGQWKVSATWPGDGSWDKTETGNSTNIGERNHSILLTVSGPARTVAVANPDDPANSQPVTDMICPPMIIGSTDAGEIFGHDRAYEMRIIRWSPASKSYFRYGVSGLFPALQPGDAMWIRPRQFDPVTRVGYPVAEPLGMPAIMSAQTDGTRVAYLPERNGDCNYVATVKGVYLNSDKSGLNYYDPLTSDAANRFKHGDRQVTLTRALPSGQMVVYVDYVDYPFSAVDDGWISLDNPSSAKAVDGFGEARYLHTNYRLIKSLAQAYPLLTDNSGAIVKDPATDSPMLKPSMVSLKAGWNQFGNIFFNWKKSTQTGYVVPGNSAKVTPTQSDTIGKLLGVYLNQQGTVPNYYRPGQATQSQVFQRGGSEINLTSPVPAGTGTVYIKHEVYPRVDVGIPIGECNVIYLGQRKSIAEAKVAGWISDYAWRYDPARREYVQVSATAAGAERVLKAWSGYWIKAYVDCQLEINPNTTYNGEGANASAASAMGANLYREEAATQRLETPPAVPSETDN